MTLTLIEATTRHPNNQKRIVYTVLIGPPNDLLGLAQRAKLDLNSGCFVLFSINERQSGIRAHGPDSQIQLQDLYQKETAI